MQLLKIHIRLFLCLFLIVPGAIAQMRIAAVGGWQSGKLKDIGPSDKITAPYLINKTRNSLNIGFLFDVPLETTKPLHIVSGMYLSGKGSTLGNWKNASPAALPDSSWTSEQFLPNYAEFPLNIGYVISLRKQQQLYLSTGPYFSFFLNGKRITESRNYTSKTYTYNKTDFAVGNEVNKITTTDYGWNFRAFLDLGKFLLSAHYTKGVKKVFSNSDGNAFQNGSFGVTLGFWLNRLERPSSKDRDKDGTPDVSDACPDIAGPAAAHGCPDQDNDGLADLKDNCPQKAGSAKYGGCPIPDSDHDGLNDEEDQCPILFGTPRHQGCPAPDSDEDGIPDEKDHCPTIKGKERYEGCPVPDSDGDGLDDETDRCPEEKGSSTYEGCPEPEPTIIEKFSYAASNIFFGLNSTRILPESFQALDEVAGIMAEHPECRLTINGHTDNMGNAAYNLSISQKRADAVKAYLVGKGIAASRITATGYGHQKPIADNQTVSGRAKNRRVELVPAE